MAIHHVRERKAKHLPGKPSMPRRTSAEPANRGPVPTHKSGDPTSPKAAAAGGKTSRANNLLQLQRTRGNRAVTKLVAASRKSVQSAGASHSAKAALTGRSGAAGGDKHGKTASAHQATASAPSHAPTSTAQQRLLSAAADAHAAFAALPEPSIPQPKSAGSRILLNTLREAAKKGRESLATATAASIHATATTSQRHAEVVSIAESKSVEQVRGHVQSSRQHVSDALTEHSGAVLVVQNGEREKLQAWHGQANSRAHDEVNKRQESMTAVGAEQAAQIQESGTRAAQSASASLASASTDAHSQDAGGSDDRAAGRAEVASRLGNDASSQIDSAAPENADQLHAHANDAAETLTSHTSQAATAIGGVTPMLQGQIDQTVAGAAGELNRAGERSVAALHAGAGHAHQQLNTVESKAIELTARGAAKHRELIHSAGADAVTGMRHQAEKAVGLAQQQLNEHAAHLAATNVDEKTAGAVAPQLQSQIAKAYAATAGEAHDLENKVGGHLATAAQEGTNALSRMPAQTATGLASANHMVVSEMTRVSNGTQAAIHRGMNATVAQSNEAVSKTAEHLDQAVTQAKSGFQVATGSIGRSLDTAVGEISRKAKDALTGLHGRITEGQSRVDDFVVQKGLTVQRSWIGDVGDWLSDQFSDLLDMLSSKAFWVGLVVTLVLFPVLGPAALIVGGAAGGAVSGIEQNIAQGKSWYDWHNIVRNAAIGAAAGAVMALGLVAIEALGLEGLAATAAVMGLSAVIGIVVNLVNGQRWDKGLLANLFLAWLFQRAAGGKTPETTPEEVPPGQKPPEQPTARPSATAPEGMSTTLQGLRAGLTDPRAIAQFDAMFQRLGGNSAKMEPIVSRFPDLQQRMIDDWEAANPTPRGEALSEVAPLKARAEALQAQIEAFRAANPKAIGVGGRLTALKGEITRLDGMLQGRIEATPEGVQGTRNNIGGIEAELRTAQSANNVTGLGAKFSLDGVPGKVEVDVVADDGKTWIDTKNVPSFGLESSDWVGGPGKQGLQTQAIEMVRAAGQNKLPSGETPRVVIDFPKGVSPEVAAALRAIGAEPRGTIVRALPGALVPVGPPRDDDRKKVQ